MNAENFTQVVALYIKKMFLPDAFHHIDASDIACCDTSTNSLREVPVKYGVVFLVESGVAKKMHLRLNPRSFHF